MLKTTTTVGQDAVEPLINYTLIDDPNAHRISARWWAYYIKSQGPFPTSIPQVRSTLLPINLTARGYPSPIQAEAELSLHEDTLHVVLRDKGATLPLTDGGTWGGDHWELFFANQRAKPYRQMGISATGSVAEVAVGEETWSSGFRIQTESGSNEWITTLDLPLSSLLPGLTSTSTFYMNILRCPNGDAEPAFWSPVFQGGYHCPERLGEVTLGQPSPVRPPKARPAFHLSLDCDDIDAPVKLLFPGGRPRAVALSFDDGLESDKRFIEILKKYNMKATFHVPVQCSIPSNEIGRVYAGHEVAIHDGNGDSVPADFVTQVTNAGHALANLTGQTVAGLAYVGGSFTEEGAAALEKAGVVYARTIGTERWFNLQTNRFLMLSTSGHQHQAIPLAKQFLEFPGKPAVLSIWGHTYEFASEADWQRIEEFCQLVGKREDTWYASLLELVIYTKAALKLQVDPVSKTIHNPTKTQIYIEVDGKVEKLTPGDTWTATD